MIDVGYHHQHKDNFEHVSFNFEVGNIIRLQYFGSEKKFIVSKEGNYRFSLLSYEGTSFTIFLLRMTQS
jgi:hypothetical protein